MSFDKALPVILAAEGGFSDDRADPGGRTNFGITQATYDAWRTKHGEPAADVKDIPEDTVAAIYRFEYWLAGRCDRLPWPLALVHFDGCVNHGLDRAARLLQEVAGVAVDGKIGPLTIAAVSAAPLRMASALITRRRGFYADIPKRRPQSAKFLPGWLRRMDHLAKACGVLA